ncbi:E3 ubiquitin-protein ligase ZFP91 [Colossoma macropomum]|uniref:E3 ubiquitin-protein ligase ZFP91 n=1 Tax=Colossoma macropomum TaxID=42526 RepID=UPI001864F228|nr:E3 ubiquitin-protein ligase ZFP91 [Colossoma macropomum]
MELQHGDGQLSDNKEEKCGVEKAAQKSPDHSQSETPKKLLRGRCPSRLKARESPGELDTNANGAGANAVGSGRVLRDRSARALPAWKHSEKKEHRDEELVEESRRRKAAPPRRSKATEAGKESGPAGRSGESKDAGSSTRAGGGRRTQSRSRTPSSWPQKSITRVVCKSEPEAETLCVETDKAAGKRTGESDQKKTEGEEDDVLGEEEPPYVDDLKDQNYQPQCQSDDDVGISSDEDVPFRDDLNDQSYDPKSERDTPKSRRKAPPRLREKKEKMAVVEKEKEVQAEVKKEGGDGVDVKVEFGEGAEPPRKRGRRRKDDKSPRLPKRRKKPPVQYVRCEMEGCGTVLAHPRYLQHHIKYQHLMKKKYVCPHPSCGRLFRLQKQLLRHAKHHTDQRDYICEFCARAFKSSHNLAVHRMIHTGEKPLQCEICGFTCRQKASLNWHMKKHDADASYQFSCSICGKKFEKKDSVVAHKAKSHPEVLIAEALAANAGALITTPGALLEAPTGALRTEQMQEVQLGSVQVPVSQVGSLAQVGHVGPVVVVDPDHSLPNMQVPVTLALPTAEEELGSGTGSSHSVSTHTLQALPLHFVTTPVSQQQQQPQVQQLPLQHSVTQQATLVQPLPVQSYPTQPQILHMTFRAVPHQQQIQQLPLLSVAQQLPHQSQAIVRAPNPSSSPVSTGSSLTQNLPETSSSDCRGTLGFSTEPPPPSSASPPHVPPTATREGRAVWEGKGPEENGNVGGVWEAAGESQEQVMTDSSEGQIQHGLM